MKRSKRREMERRRKKEAVAWSIDRQVENAVYHLRREREEAARRERNRAAVLAWYARYIKRKETETHEEERKHGGDRADRAGG